MTKGYVYILSNPSMPGLLKIGKTTRSVSQRCHELYVTGVPTPFEVVEEVPCPNCHELEARMHAHYEKVRVSASREFFACEVIECSHQLLLFQMEQVRMLINEYLPDYDIVEASMSVCSQDIFRLADDLEAHPFQVVTAIELLKPEELEPALGRYMDRVALRKEARAKGLEMPSIHEWREGPIQ